MIFWNQADGNNVAVSGLDKLGFNKFPGYNMKMGYANGSIMCYLLFGSIESNRAFAGAQNDIFAS